MSLPSNAGSCMTCSACGNYTNFYKNSTKTFDVTQYLQDTNSIYVYFHNFTGGYSYKISNLEFTIKTYSKLQFTDTITSKATQLLSNSISTNLAIQNQETFTFKALDPGSNQVVGYSKSYIFTKKLRASFKYAKHIIVKFSGTANDYATINLNLGGNNYNYQSNASYYFAGCYSSVKPDGSFVDFVNYNLDQNINFNNNQVNVKITQHGTCSLWTDISVQGSILVQYKQFTSTVKLSSNSSYATINKDIPVGYFFTNLGDDNSDALRGTWNADRTVKTVTSSTADWSDYLISGADIVFLNSDIHDGLTCLKFSDGRNVNIPQNFEVTIDKMIPFYEYHQGNDDPSFPTHRKDGYYFYLTISPIWFTSFSNANILLSNRNNMNGSYNFTFKFNYNNKDYSFKKTLVISF